MQSFLDKLPLDILRYEIVPYLDYQTRTALNLSLQPKDRQGYSLQKISPLISAIHKKKLQFVKNSPDPYWTPIGSSTIIEHPRKRNDSENHVFTLREMTREQRIMKGQLKSGQRFIHENIRSGVYKREHHSELPLKCKCCT